MGIGEVSHDTESIGSIGSSAQYLVSDVESSGGDGAGGQEKRLRAGCRKERRDVGNACTVVVSMCGLTRAPDDFRSGGISELFADCSIAK